MFKHIKYHVFQVDMSGKLADLAGYTHRVGEIIEIMKSHKPDTVYGNTGLYGVNLSEREDKEDLIPEKSDTVIVNRQTSGISKYSSPLSPDTINTPSSDTPPQLLTLKNLTITHPITNKCLVHNLTFSLNSSNTALLLHGPPAAGKSSILRAIKSLWQPAMGSVHSTSDVLFLPQRPYFTRDSLAAQITLPEPPDESRLGELERILERVCLSGVLEECQFTEENTDHISTSEPSTTSSNNQSDTELVDPEPIGRVSCLPSSCCPTTNPLKPSTNLLRIPKRSWHKILSPGKQQLLAFSRVLYHSPELVVMDEATSAVSADIADTMYGILRENGTCYVSVSHDETLERFHDTVIVLDGDGPGWGFRE